MAAQNHIFILAVEDSDDDYAFLERMLRLGFVNRPYTLLRASYANEVTRLITTNPISVILLDLGLPETSFGASYRLVQSMVTHKIPIVVQTITNDPDWIQKIMSSGSQDYLIKSEMTPDSLRKSILFAIERHSYHRELEDMNSSLEQKEGQLMDAARMDAVGKMAAGLVHSLKNPLATIMFGIHYLTDLGNDDETVREVIQRMLRSVGRADRIVSDLLDFSAEPYFTPSTIDLCEIIESATEVIDCRLDTDETTIILDKDIPNGPITISGDRRKLEHMIVNLLDNAVEAVSKVSDPKIRFTLKAKPECDIILEIADNGCGIAEELRKSAVIPFFTTKAASGGTGLGLAVVDRVVRLHGGSFNLESRENETVAEVTLPLLIRTN